MIIFGWAKINPDIAPRSPKFPWNERVKSLPESCGRVVIFFVVIGGLMKGFFTPTEAGSVGTFAVLLLSLLSRET